MRVYLGDVPTEIILAPNQGLWAHHMHPLMILAVTCEVDAGAIISILQVRGPRKKS